MKTSSAIRPLSGLILSPALLLSACSQQSANVKYDLFAPPTLSRGNENERYSSAPDDKSTIQNADSLPQEHDTIWSRLFDLYKLPAVDNHRVQREMEWFLAHPDYLRQIQERAQPYLYAIVEEIESNDIPGEIALLPVIESAFKPYAYSRSHAAGLWQFIPSTGRLYGLEQNWWYDGRRDVYASTKAAVRYLKKLGNDFDGDWFLALAAYNSGEGTVSKAVKANLRNDQPADYWSLDLPEQAEAYVPRLIAISKLFANAEEFGVDLRPIPNESAIEAVEVGSQLDLRVAARLANISLTELFNLNPAFNRHLMAPDGPYRLLLPVDKVEFFKQRLATLPAGDKVVMRRHRIGAGETLTTIANRHQTSVAALRKINDLAGDSLRVGQELIVPNSNPAANVLAEDEKRKALFERQASREQKRIHTIKRGDTLFKIARQYGVDAKEVARWNDMTTRAVLRTGDKLVVRQSASGSNVLAVARKSAPSTVDYTVRKGDSLFDISRRFNVSVADLRKWNSVGKHLKPGQVIKVQLSSGRNRIEEG